MGTDQGKDAATRVDAAYRQSESTRILTAAQALHVAGVSVIPLSHPAEGGDGKKPTVDWKRYQVRRCRASDVAEWFGRPEALHNIGVVTGPLSGIVVIDIDSKEAKQAVNRADWPFPERWVRTAKGEHWYFGWSDEHPVSNRSRLTISGQKVAVDIRGQGGYVVGPGSRHASGELYVAEAEGESDWGSLPVLDPEIASQVSTIGPETPKRFVPSVKDDAEIAFRLSELASSRTKILLRDGAPEGERNERVFRAARDMNGLGIPQAVALEKLARAVSLTPREISRTVKSAYATPALPAALYGVLGDGDEVDHLIDAEGGSRAAPVQIVFDVDGMPESIAGTDAEGVRADSVRGTVSGEERGRSDHLRQRSDDDARDVHDELPDEGRADADEQPVLESAAIPERTGDAGLPNADELRAAAGRPPRLSNVDVIEKEGEDKKITRVFIARHIQTIRSGFVGGLSEWPRVVNGTLFAPRIDPGGVHGWDGRRFATHDDIYWMQNEPALFSWAHSVCDGVFWHQGAARAGFSDPTPATPVTRAEFFAKLVQAPARRHESIEVFPHVPPREDSFYLVPRLPKADPALPTWKAWLKLFNPETPEDLALLAAASLTPLWGGKPGQRPAFLISSEHGRGVGKTKTAQAIAAIYGGSIEASTPDKKSASFEAVAKALVSPEGVTRRVVVWDNLKGRADFAQVESMITAPSIQSHRLYVGHTVRVNNLTWFLTANAPSVSNDLAQRAVPVMIGRPKHAVDFDSQYQAFLDEHRPALIAEMITILEGPDQWTMPDSLADRWQAWGRAVLCKVPGGEAAMKSVLMRRTEMDADREDAQHVLDTVLQMIAVAGSANIVLAKGEFEFDMDSLYTMAVDNGIAREHSKIGFAKWVNNKIKAHELPWLTSRKTKGKSMYRADFGLTETRSQLDGGGSIIFGDGK